MKAGTRVVVVDSWHSDIGPGMEGVVAKRIRRGYAVNITAWFFDAVGHRHSETRCVFFDSKSIKATDPR